MNRTLADMTASGGHVIRAANQRLCANAQRNIADGSFGLAYFLIRTTTRRSKATEIEVALRRFAFDAIRHFET